MEGDFNHFDNNYQLTSIKQDNVDDYDNIPIEMTPHFYIEKRFGKFRFESLFLIKSNYPSEVDDSKACFPFNTKSSSYFNNIDDQILKKVEFPPPYVPPPFVSLKKREYLTEIDETDVLFDEVIQSENNYLIAKKADTNEFFFKICNVPGVDPNFSNKQLRKKMNPNTLGMVENTGGMNGGILLRPDYSNNNVRRSQYMIFPKSIISGKPKTNKLQRELEEQKRKFPQNYDKDGNLLDLTKYKCDSAGNIILDSNGNPIPIQQNYEYQDDPMVQALNIFDKQRREEQEKALQLKIQQQKEMDLKIQKQQGLINNFYKVKQQSNDIDDQMKKNASKIFRECSKYEQILSDINDDEWKSLISNYQGCDPNSLKIKSDEPINLLAALGASILSSRHRDIFDL